MPGVCADGAPGAVTAVVAAAGLPATAEGFVAGDGRDAECHLSEFEIRLSPRVHTLWLPRIATGRASLARGPAQRRTTMNATQESGQDRSNQIPNRLEQGP